MKSIVMGAWVGAAALMAAVATAAPLSAQGPDAGAKVAYVNTREILMQTPGYAAAESLYAKEFEAAKAEARKINASLDSAGSDFERQSAMLTGTARTAKQKALSEYAQKMQQQLQTLDAKMNAREREILEPIQKRINAVIEGVRAEGKYAIVFDVSAPNSPIVTADTSLDLTATVIKRLK